LPVDFVKIDGDIVADLDRSRLSRAMVEAIHQVAHVMDARTIAEKVESASLLSTLREIGLDLAQGYHIARPRPIRESEDVADHLPTPYAANAGWSP
ncbi:MAG: EAL domain-containing protein, partial [Holophagales bacterium]|nr:EAL domain-containing protein [Holophagales bacterium]